MRAFFPFTDLRGITRAEVQRDVLASLVVTFTAVPQCVAYAVIAGLPPAAGLYAAILPTIVGSIFRSSRHVVAGPSNAVSLLVGGAVGVLAAELGATPMEVALSLALMVGLMQVGAGVLRLGSVVDYISSPVVLGYITGAGVLIGVGQLDSLTGTEGGSGHIVAKVTTWATGLSDLNPIAVALGVATAALVVGIRTWNKKLPSALMGLSIATAASVSLGLGDQLQVVGDLDPVPASLPPLTIPSIFDPRLVMVALATTVLSLVESSAVGRSIADRTGDRLNLSVEFTGQGLSNIAAAFTGGYPVSGSLSRSALNHSAGAATRLSGILAGIFTAVVLLVAGPLVDQTPTSALAGLLMVVAYDLVNPTRIRQTFRTSRGDALAFLATLIGTWVLRLDHAIYLGVALSIGLFLRRARMLAVRELAVNDRGRLQEMASGEGSRCAHVRVVHVEGPMFFGAAGELRDALSEYTRDPAMGALVVRLKRAQGLDFTTAQVLVAIAQQLKKRGAGLFLVGMRPEAMEVLRRAEATEQIGADRVFPTRPGWFDAMDAALEAALDHSNAPDDSPLRRYLALRDALRRPTSPTEAPMQRPAIVGVVGWKNSGKTTLTARIVTELTRRGFRVSTIKHAHVRFDIDHPGRDSYRHREAGAVEVAIASPKRWAVMRELHDEPEPTLDEMVGRLSPCDVIVVEGYKRGPHPKVEIRREGARQRDPLAPTDPHIIAVASDSPDDEPAGPPVFGIDDISQLTDFLEDRLSLRAPEGRPR